jgi:hypothetical protein
MRSSPRVCTLVLFILAAANASKFRHSPLAQTQFGLIATHFYPSASMRSEGYTGPTASYIQTHARKYMQLGWATLLAT